MYHQLRSYDEEASRQQLISHQLEEIINNRVSSALRIVSLYMTHPSARNSTHTNLGAHSVVVALKVLETVLRWGPEFRI